MLSQPGGDDLGRVAGVVIDDQDDRAASIHGQQVLQEDDEVFFVKNAGDGDRSDCPVVDVERPEQAAGLIAARGGDSILVAPPVPHGADQRQQFDARFVSVQHSCRRSRLNDSLGDRPLFGYLVRVGFGWHGQPADGPRPSQSYAVPDECYCG